MFVSNAFLIFSWFATYLWTFNWIWPIDSIIFIRVNKKMHSNGWAKSFNLSISTLDEKYVNLSGIWNVSTIIISFIKLCQSYAHSKRRILLIVFTVVTFLLTLVLNILNSIGLKIFGKQKKQYHNLLSSNPTESMIVF